jgi:SAM-dependent methyltransferase
LSEEKKYLKIVKHYEECLEKYGDSHLGVDWPNKEDADKRYRVMLELTRRNGEDTTLLDFGCGAAHLYEYIRENGINNINYSGLDISEKFISLCKEKFKDIKFYNVDILETPEKVDTYDYIVMNGVLTEKLSLSFDDMFEYFKKIIKAVYARTGRGMAFNVMSKQVDWERDDLFHLPLDMLAGFLTKEVTRNFVIRNDYGLYEYTVYLYK